MHPPLLEGAFVIIQSSSPKPTMNVFAKLENVTLMFSLTFSWNIYHFFSWLFFRGGLHITSYRNLRFAELPHPSNASSSVILGTKQSNIYTGIIKNLTQKSSKTPLNLQKNSGGLRFPPPQKNVRFLVPYSPSSSVIQNLRSRPPPRKKLYDVMCRPP